MKLPDPERAGSAVEIAALLLALPDDERREARIRRRAQATDARLRVRELQGKVRVADSFAKLGGGSLLTASLLLMINGQVSWPIAVTAMLALLVFVASTMFVYRLDRAIARLENDIDVIDAALKETER